jgi:hypothetical protein
LALVDPACGRWPDQNLRAGERRLERDAGYEGTVV